MPIEIKELHIHVEVKTSPEGPAPTGRQNSAAGKDNDNEAIIAECVEQVLQILQNKKER